jgi:hypothetical protein
MSDKIKEKSGLMVIKTEPLTGSLGSLTRLGTMGSLKPTANSALKPKGLDVNGISQKVTAATQTGATLVAAEDAKRKLLNGIAFVIDATGSREHNWREAQAIQADLFKIIAQYNDNPEITILSYGGGTLKTLGTFKTAPHSVTAMGKVGCISGNTQIVEALETILKRNPCPRSVYVVGDAFEESMTDLTQTLQKFAAKAIRIHSFVEGNDADAHKAFLLMANMTKGVFNQFGQTNGLSMQDVCAATATFDTGGLKAFQDLLASGNNKGALAIAHQVSRLALPKA